MVRQAISALVLATLFGSASTASAQTAWQFRFQKGQDLVYRVRHETAVTEVVQGSATESASTLDIVKRWKIVDVDAAGVATMDLSIERMRNEQKRPGDVLVFDSTNLDKSTPELKAMAKFLGTTIASIRVDKQGRVLEVKAGPKGKYEAEPPFALVLPEAQAAAGQSWSRPFTITLDPPLGAGEKHQAEQMAACSKIEAGKATLTVTTKLKAPPESPQELVPLVQKLLQGQVVVDLAAGRIDSVQLAVDRTVENHQGKGSSYRFRTTYAETYMPGGLLEPLTYSSNELTSRCATALRWPFFGAGKAARSASVSGTSSQRNRLAAPRLPHSRAISFVTLSCVVLGWPRSSFWAIRARPLPIASTLAARRSRLSRSAALECTNTTRQSSGVRVSGSTSACVTTSIGNDRT